MHGVDPHFPSDPFLLDNGTDDGLPARVGVVSTSEKGVCDLVGQDKREFAFRTAAEFGFFGKLLHGLLDNLLRRWLGVCQRRRDLGASGGVNFPY